MMTRSGRITREKLKKRDPEFVAAYEDWLQRAEGNPSPATGNQQTNVAS
jgi:hypothetical protein